MTTTKAPDRDGLIRIGGSKYDQPVKQDEDGVYRRGIWLVACYEDDGERYITTASNAVLAAWGITR